MLFNIYHHQCQICHHHHHHHQFLANILTTAFFNHCADRFNIIIGQFEDIVKTIEHHLDYLRVLYTKQVAQRPYHTLTDDVRYLHRHRNAALTSV